MDFASPASARAGAAASGLVVGTANYMSPEAGDGRPGRRGAAICSAWAAWLAEMAGGGAVSSPTSVMSTLYRIAQSQPLLDLPDGEDGDQLGPSCTRARKGSAGRIATRGSSPRRLRALLERPSLGPPSWLARRPVSERLPQPGLASADSRRRAHPRGSARSSRSHGEPATNRLPVADPSPLFRLLREIYVGGKSESTRAGVRR